LTILFSVDISDTVGPGVYQNAVEAVSSNQAVTPFDELNTSDDDVEVQVAFISLSKAGVPAVIHVTDPVTYTIVARSLSNSTTIAEGVLITDVLPSGFTYTDTLSIQTSGAVTATGDISSSTGATSPVWGQWDIGPGGAITITFVCGSSSTPGMATNTVIASSENDVLIDPLENVAPIQQKPTLIGLLDFIARSPAPVAWRTLWLLPALALIGLWLYKSRRRIPSD
jgi:uncharacterized repeat protein (TIGR01451 family)